MIREATPKDFHAVMRLYRQLRPDDPILDDGSDQATFEAILNTPGLTLLVLEADGAVVATTYLNVIPNMSRSASPYAVIENVVVDENLRGTGLGKQIMAGTLTAAWVSGCYKGHAAYRFNDAGDARLLPQLRLVPRRENGLPRPARRVGRRCYSCCDHLRVARHDWRRWITTGE